MPRAPSRPFADFDHPVSTRWLGLALPESPAVSDDERDPPPAGGPETDEEQGHGRSFMDAFASLFGSAPAPTTRGAAMHPSSPTTPETAPGPKGPTTRQPTPPVASAPPAPPPRRATPPTAARPMVVQPMVVRVARAGRPAPPPPPPGAGARLRAKLPPPSPPLLPAAGDGAAWLAALDSGGGAAVPSPLTPPTPPRTPLPPSAPPASIQRPVVGPPPARVGATATAASSKSFCGRPPPLLVPGDGLEWLDAAEVLVTPTEEATEEASSDPPGACWQFKALRWATAVHATSSCKDDTIEQFVGQFIDTMPAIWGPASFGGRLRVPTCGGGRGQRPTKFSN